ncbi:MAG: outer membrane lipoprotein carrier protein LolA [Acidobacteriia bacterium]|nr:outer membrane lipoprotein carrier protein LolA [Terriglobia bacterium]
MTVAANSVDAASILDQVQKKYASLESLQADFVQKLIQGKDQRVESGVLWLRRGAKMRWDYASPEHKIFLVDGKTQFTWIPSENRVYREPLKSSEDRRTPILLLLGKLHWRKVFTRVELVSESSGSYRIRAHPKNESLGYQSLDLEIEKNTLHLVRIDVENVDRTRMEFTFSGVTENPRLDPQRFVFRIPKGAEVIDQAEM